MNKAVSDLVNKLATWDASGHQVELVAILDKEGVKHYGKLDDKDDGDWKWWYMSGDTVHATGSRAIPTSYPSLIYTYGDVMSFESGIEGFFASANANYERSKS